MSIKLPFFDPYQKPPARDHPRTENTWYPFLRTYTTRGLAVPKAAGTVQIKCNGGRITLSQLPPSLHRVAFTFGSNLTVRTFVDIN